MQVRTEGGRTWFEVELRDVWVSDMYRTNRFLASARVLENGLSGRPRDRVGRVRSGGRAGPAHTLTPDTGCAAARTAGGTAT